MNYYPFHLGDYAKDTAHLTMLEDGAYRRLLDLYYTRERPLPGDPQTIYRLCRARTKPERQAIDAVLQEFFVCTENQFTHNRCEKEIETLKVKKLAAQTNGAKGGRPKRQGLQHDSAIDEKNPLGLQDEPAGFFVGYENETQQKAHQSQSQSQTQYPNTKSQKNGSARSPLSASPPTFDQVLELFNRSSLQESEWVYEAEKFFDYYESGGWMRKGDEIYSLQALVDSWVNRMEDFA